MKRMGNSSMGFKKTVAFAVYNAGIEWSVSRIMRRQAEYLVQRGWRVLLVSNLCPSTWVKVEELPVSPFLSKGWKRLDFLFNALSIRMPRKLRSWMSLEQIVPELLFGFACRKAIAELHIKVDLWVACQHATVPGLMGFWKHDFSVPVLLASYGDIFEHPLGSYSLPTQLLYRWAAKSAYRNAARVIAISSRIAQRAVRCGAIPDRTSVIHPGVDPPDPAYVVSRRNSELGTDLLFIGRLSKEKGVDVLLRAVSLLQDLPARLTIIGNGPEAEALEQLARKLGIAKRTSFVGAMPLQALTAYYRESDIFVLPSRSEGLALVLLEAQSFGIPIVATHVGGIPEIIRDEEEGLMVDPDEPNQLAQALRRLIVDPELRTRLGKAGKEVARAHAWPDLLQRFEEEMAITIGYLRLQQERS
jgi:glycosyltransferase involved in cell wall biosynthesis